jgi:hypothetical protein
VSVSAAAPGAAQPRPNLDLSPLAAARALWDMPQLAGRDAGPRLAAAPDRPPPDAEQLASQVPGLRSSARGSVQGTVTDAAEDAIYTGLRPWKLLERTMRGSAYRYTGSGFDAAIMPDGRVRFRDKGGTRLTILALKNIDGPTRQLPPAPVVGFSFGDPASIFSRRHGKDPHAAERRTFLERTHKLRKYLAERAGLRGAQDEEAPTEPTEREPRDEPRVEPQVEPPLPSRAE